jgi:hypothetical protein
LDSQEQILKDIESRREQKSRDEIHNLKARLEVRYHVASVFYQWRIFIDL